MRSSPARVAAIAVLATLALLVVGGVVFMYSGAYNVAATADHTPLGRWVLETTQERSVQARADEVPEAPAFDADMVDHGFEHFRAMCVVCHGAPGVDRGEFGQGLTPRPPRLSHAAEEWNARELFWMVKHGIKLAGMPAFGPTHSDQEIWGIVAFLERLPEMTEAEYAALEASARASAAADTTGAGADGGHSHAPGTADHSH